MEGSNFGLVTLESLAASRARRPILATVIRRLFQFLSSLSRRQPAPTPVVPDPAGSPLAPVPRVLPLWATTLGDAARFDEFLRLVGEYFRRRGLSAEVGDGHVVVRADTTRVCGLGNLVQLCAASDQADWRGLIASHFDTLERAERWEKSLERRLADFAFAGRRLVIRLWEEGSLPHHLHEEPDYLITRRDLPGLLTVLALDLPESVRTIRREEAVAWGMDDAELFELALRNTMGLVSPEVTRIDGRVPIRILAADSMYTASLVLNIPAFPELVGTHGAFVSLPVRSLVLALPFEGRDSLPHLAGLAAMTHKIEHDGPGSLSPRLFWYRRGVFTELPYNLTPSGIQVAPPPQLINLLESLEPPE